MQHQRSSIYSFRMFCVKGCGRAVARPHIGDSSLSRLHSSCHQGVASVWVRAITRRRLTRRLLPVTGTGQSGVQIFEVTVVAGCHLVDDLPTAWTSWSCP